MSSADAAVVTTDLTKHFGSVHAVEGLDIEVRRGEVFGFLGPNGAGKTTTIRMLLDFLRPTRGSTRVLGGEPRDPEVRRRIGFLPADLHLDPRYTGDEVLSFFADLRGGVDAALRASLVERFELDPRRPVGELSTGNRRKVGIVAAFMHRPELLILDEPTSGLDPLLQHQFQVVVADAVAGGASVLLSSHVLPEVERTADRVGIVRTGRLVQVATVDELRTVARQRIELHLAEPAPTGAFDGVPGVVESSAVDGVVVLVVEGSVDAVVKAAARLSVERLVTHETDLEDVFLDLYQDDAR